MYNNISYIDNQDDTKKSVNAFLEEWYNESPFISVNTSGSTGSSVQVFLEKENMIISAKKTIDFLGIQPNSTTLLCLSIETIAGKMMVVRSIVGNLALIIGPTNSNPLKNIDLNIDFAAFVPLQIQKILDSNPEKLKAIKSTIVGGGPISNKLEYQLKQQEITLFHTFGMTETISHVALRRVGFKGENFFRGLKGIYFSVENGQLIIHYPEIGLIELKTTDLVKLNSDNTFEWIGRADFIINSGGIKINPEEVEFTLSFLISQPFLIAGLPDEKLGKKVVLIIESQENMNFSKIDFASILSKYSIPKMVYFIPKFERTLSGKINRIETVKLLKKYVPKEIL
jgi:O-succinylbenzoic acid--CoA ligase